MQAGRLALLLGGWLCAAPEPSFPLPAPDGKVLPSAPGQRVFQVPFGVRAVEKFYRDRFAKDADVSFDVRAQGAGREVTIKSRTGRAWARAVLREKAPGTEVEVVPVMRAGAETVSGNGRPLVEFVITRSADAAKLVESIDHTERP